MNPSILTKHQVKIIGPKRIRLDGQVGYIHAEIRYDDSPGNGRNTLALTGEITLVNRTGDPTEDPVVMGGCLHGEIAEHFPELAPYVQWHLMSTDGPLHYVPNTLYWAGQRGYCFGGLNDPPNFRYARHCAIWPEATDEDLASPDLEDKLNVRLPGLLQDFRAAVESLGFIY